jgi:hypothetical protein
MASRMKKKSNRAHFPSAFSVSVFSAVIESDLIYPCLILRKLEFSGVCNFLQFLEEV